ncbi:hypothetical protein [Fulvitalea axinellae]
MEANSKETIVLYSQGKSKPFPDLRSAFEVIIHDANAGYPSSLKDTSMCSGFTISEAEAIEVLSHVRPISGAEWHHLFYHLPCQVIGEIRQDGYTYDLEINGGAWLTISSADSSQRFGSFELKYDSLFLTNVERETSLSAE